MRPAICALALTLTLGACQQSRSYYAWGVYSDSVWRSTYGDAQSDIGADIDSLERTIERARSFDQPVAPGLHAHLGMLHGQRGNIDAAVAALETEKELFPESAVLMDRLIAQAKGESVGGIR